MARAAEIVGACARNRQKHQLILRIDRDRCPGVAGAGAKRILRLPVLPGRVIGSLRDRTPGPSQRSSARVEGSHRSERFIDGSIVTDSGTDDDQVVDDRGRRGLLVFAVVTDAVDIFYAALEIDASRAAEVGAGFSRGGVECD